MPENTKDSAPTVHDYGFASHGSTDLTEPEDKNRKARCAACGLPGHRFGRNEGMERFDRQACINLLRYKHDEAHAALERAHALLSWIDGACVDELPHSEIAAAISRYYGEGET